MIIENNFFIKRFKCLIPQNTGLRHKELNDVLLKIGLQLPRSHPGISLAEKGNETWKCKFQDDLPFSTLESSKVLLNLPLYQLSSIKTITLGKIKIKKNTVVFSTCNDLFTPHRCGLLYWIIVVCYS